MRKKSLMLTAFAAMMTLATATAAFAADSTVSNETELKNAVSTAQSGDTITLSSDITLSSVLEIETGITLDGADFAITAPENVNALSITADDVTVKDLEINTSVATTNDQYKGYGITATGSNLTVTGCTINAESRGIDFRPTDTGATLNVEDTIIKNTMVTDYNKSANYSLDARGIATSNVKDGYIYIDGSQILGFKYSINALADVADPDNPNSIRDGQGTIFDVYDTTVKGWTALNIWSADTDFYFTDCNLVGINTQSGATNHYSTIMANDMIYGRQEGKTSTVTFYGGDVTAVKLGACDQSLFNVDYEFETEYVFEQDDYGNPVALNYYGPENNEGQPVHYIHTWNFHFLYAGNEAKTTEYLNSKVTGFENENGELLYVTLNGGSLTEYDNMLSGISTNALLNDVEVQNLSKQHFVGGDI